MNIVILSVMFFQEALISNKDMVKIFIKRANGDLIYYPKIFSKFLSCFYPINGAYALSTNEFFSFRYLS